MSSSLYNYVLRLLCKEEKSVRWKSARRKVFVVAVRIIKKTFWPSAIGILVAFTWPSIVSTAPFEQQRGFVKEARRSFCWSQSTTGIVRIQFRIGYIPSMYNIFEVSFVSRNQVVVAESVHDAQNESHDKCKDEKQCFKETLDSLPVHEIKYKE